MKSFNRKMAPRRARCLFPAALAAATLLAFQPAVANTLGPDVNFCMDNIYGPSNCTANDVKIARATNVSPSSCVKGTKFDLTATFEVATTATQRYDVGVMFDVSGDGLNGARSGSCTLSSFDLPSNQAGVHNFDQDACGDTASADSPAFLTVTLPQVECADNNNDGFLDLPYIVSWSNSAGNVCSSATDALPQTKSKCKADDTFNVPVTVKAPEGTVAKTAAVLVTYTVQINNTSGQAITVTSLEDSVYGDLLALPAGSNITTDCVSTLVNKPIADNSSASCSFSVPFNDTAAGNNGSTAAVTDNVTARGTAEDGQTFTFTSNDKSVTVFITPKQQ